MTDTQDNIPTLHHLNNSQSQRILWLLEELSTPYNLILHTRNPATHPTRPFLSPPDLAAIGHGKAPLLITGPDDGSRIITESSAIALYLLTTFPTNFPSTRNLSTKDLIREETLISFNLSTLGRLTTNMLMLDFNVLANGPGVAGKAFDGPALRGALGWLEGELESSPPGGFFLGASPSRADILFEFPLSMIKQRGWVDLQAEFPGLNGWLERVYGREAWERGLERGNGYDLTSFTRRPHLCCGE